MKPKLIAKITIDMAMTVTMLLLMTFELIGAAAHEWLGIGIFALFVVHHILNGKWSMSIFKGKYTPLRMFQTALVVLVLISMLGSMISGIILSRYALAFIPINGGHAFARALHMLSAYWGFVLMSLHLGLHWSAMMNLTKRVFKKPSAVRRWILRLFAFGMAGYGFYAFIKRGVGSYMLLKNQFVFFNFNEPMIFFILDYLTIMALFADVGHYLSLIVGRLSKGAAKTNKFGGSYNE